MPLPLPLAGNPITAKEAQTYIEAQIKLKECLQTHLLDSITLGQVKDQTMKDMNIFYSSDVNAFIFDKSLVMRFFPEDPKSPQADYLMVIIGAKPKGNPIEGNPTIVIAGVVDNPNGDGTYLSLPIPQPGTEQPPFKVLLKFPDQNQAIPSPIEFKIV